MSCALHVSECTLNMQTDADCSEMWLTYAPVLYPQRSSRGHTIITIKVTTGSGDVQSLGNKVASINVVDLAGSERMSATDGVAKAGGVDRKGTSKEATNINKALFNLGMMVEAASMTPPAHLSDKEKAEKLSLGIRTRASASILTKLLLESIGGNVASFLIVAVRNERQYFSEIKRSLEVCMCAFGRGGEEKVHATPFLLLRRLSC